MQEPILFNLTRKENILYGAPESSDLRVRQVAEMANAIQFIETNIEDLEDPESIQKAIIEEYQSVIKNNKEQYSNFSKLE